MGNLVLSSQNAVDNATLYGDQDTGFELTKLQDSNFSKIWRFTPAANVDGSTARFALSLGLITRCNHAAFCRHNLSQGAQMRLRAGTARLDVDFTDGEELTSPWITFGGGTNGTRVNEYGVMVSNGAPRYQHDRRFHENGFKYSEDLTQADWLVLYAAKYPDGQTVNFERGSADPTEKIVNGDLSAGTTGWTTVSGATIDASTGVLHIVSPGGTPGAGARQTLTLVPGKRYTVTGTFTGQLSGAQLFAQATNAGSTSSGAIGYLSSTGFFTFELNNVTTATQFLDFYVRRGFGNANAGDWVEIDNISVIETGGELSQTPGFLYADTYEVKAQARLVSGDPTFAFKMSGGGLTVVSATQTATSEWKWFSAQFTRTAKTDGSTGTGSIFKTTAGGVLQIRRLQIRRGASNGKYRKTTSQRRYQRLGLVAELGATNSLLQSHVYINAAWSKNVTVTAGAGTAPDGTNTITSLNGTVTGQFVQQDVSMGGTTTRALSFRFLAGGTCSVLSLNLYWFNGGASQFVQCNFNPATGAFLSSAFNGASILAAGVKDLGGGFFEAYVSGTGTDALNTQSRSQLSWPSALGTVLAWGMQNEANIVTTYIPTTTTTVTRSNDTAVVEALTWMPYVLPGLPTPEFTLYHEAIHDGIAVNSFSNASTVAVVNGGNAMFSQMTVDTAGNFNAHLQVTGGSGGTFLTVDTPIAALTVMRAAARARNLDWAYSCNGGAVQTGIGYGMPSLPSGSTTVNLIYGPSTTAYLRRVTIWPSGKSNSDLQALSTTGPSAVDYDSGWLDAMQMSLNGDVSGTWGYDYDVIRPFTSRAVEWVRVGIYDHAKTDGASPIECGRLFMGKLTLQPAINASFGLTDGWDDSATTFVETQNRRKVFNQLPKLREAVFDLAYLTPDEGAVLHEIDGSGGLSSEVMYLPDPSDLAACQRYGFLGLMEKLDPLKYPLFNTRGKSFQIRKKR